MLFLIMALFAASCSKDDGPGQSAEDTYAKFSNATAIAKADDDSISINVRWSSTQWQLSTNTDGFVSGFSTELYYYFPDAVVSPLARLHRGGQSGCC